MENDSVERNKDTKATVLEVKNRKVKTVSIIIDAHGSM